MPQRTKKNTFSPTAQVSLSALPIPPSLFALSKGRGAADWLKPMVCWATCPKWAGSHCFARWWEPSLSQLCHPPTIVWLHGLGWSPLYSLSFSLTLTFPLSLILSLSSFSPFPDMPEPTVPTFHICKGSRKSQFSLGPKMGFHQSSPNSLIGEFKKCLCRLINQCLISLIWLVVPTKHIISQKAEGPGIAGI